MPGEGNSGYTFVGSFDQHEKNEKTGEMSPVKGKAFRDNDNGRLRTIAFGKENGKWFKTTNNISQFSDNSKDYNYNRSDAQKETRKTIDDYQTKLSNAKSEEEFNEIKKAAGEALAKASTGADQSITYNGNYISKKIADLSKDLEQEEYPKSWLAKKIAWFRSLYAKFMNKNKTVRDPGVFGFIKKICAMILNIIDKLARKLQHAVN